MGTTYTYGKREAEAEPQFYYGGYGRGYYGGLRGYYGGYRGYYGKRDAEVIPNMFMDIILVTAPSDMDIVATHPMHMDTTDKHGSWTNAVPFMLNLILGCLDCLVLYLPI